MKPLLVYTLLRFALFALVAGLLLAVGLEGFPLLLVALLVSSVLSVFLLRPQREALAQSAADRTRQRVEERARLRARLDGPGEVGTDGQETDRP